MSERRRESLKKFSEIDPRRSSGPFSGPSRSVKVTKKAAKVGFDWEMPIRFSTRSTKRLAELREAVQNRTPKTFDEEIGDLLFAVVNFARKLDVEPETRSKRPIENSAAVFVYREGIKAPRQDDGRSRSCRNGRALEQGKRGLGRPSGELIEKNFDIPVYVEIDFMLKLFLEGH